MSWDEYLFYLSSRWMRRLAAEDDTNAEKGSKEPWPQWWFGALPFALKLLFQGRTRRLSR